MMLLDLFFTFFRIGLFTFGGGYAMLPLIQSEVEARGWLSVEEMVNFVAVSESTPGPFAVNMSTFIGMKTAGLPGAACATLGVVLPSFLVILAVVKGYEAFRHSRVVKGLMTGLRPAAVGMIASAVLSIGAAVLFPNGIGGIAWTPELVLSAGLFLVMAVLAFQKAHPILIICLSAAAGIAAGCLGALP